MHGLQERILTPDIALPATAKKLYKELKNALLRASEEELIRSPQADIARLLRLDPRGTEHLPGNVIIGGTLDTDFKRIAPVTDLFQRHDGALFRFSIIVAERGRSKPLDLIGYVFELRFPDDVVQDARTPRFIRFDLNVPDHNNESKGLRCHLHPGHDDLQVPSALMTPGELLELFIRSVALPERPRAV
ncbi:hypothetical protein [Haliangium sp.]|uniref:hypothetical protein n=1 Tax=Haliangium sp. TaxID=2663208 RepID=UPI003D1059DD